MPITYSLVGGSPSDQNGYTMVGQIVTDGTVGPLSRSNILSWNYTLHLDGTSDVSLASTDEGAACVIHGTASSHQGFLYLPLADLDEINGIQLIGGIGNNQIDLTWDTSYGGDLGRRFGLACIQFDKGILWNHGWNAPVGDPNAKLMFAVQSDS